MIIGNNRVAVIKNIKAAAESGDFYRKVELDDPILTSEQSREITDTYLQSRNHLTNKLKTAVAVFAAKVSTRLVNKNTEIIGIEKIPKDLRGIIITSNHFSPLENTVIRFLVAKLGRKKLNIISQTSNFAMKGAIGFIMRHCDTIPISSEPRWLAHGFMSVLNEKLTDNGDAVLLYPEQEMWFNYRKPRPPKNGAYFFAAKLSIPIISCFVEIIDMPKNDTAEFKKTKYVLHILDVLYPDREKSVKENTELLATEDYRLKKECYEKAYGKALDYSFESSDIAGWNGEI